MNGDFPKPCLSWRGKLGGSKFTSDTYLLKSLEIQFSMCQLTESARVICFSPFISSGSSLDIGYKKKRNY